MGNYTKIYSETNSGKSKMFYRSLANMVYMDESTSMTLESKIQDMESRIGQATSKPSSEINFSIGNSTKKFTGDSDISFSTEEMGIVDKISPAGISLQPVSNETWYRLGHIEQVEKFYGEFVVTHSWGNNLPIIVKFIVGGYAGTEGYSIKEIFSTYPNPTNTTRDSATITKVRVVYIPVGTSAGDVFVDICIKGGSYSKTNFWKYSICNMNTIINTGKTWINDSFTENPTMPNNTIGGYHYTSRVCNINRYNGRVVLNHDYLDAQENYDIELSNFSNGVGSIMSLPSSATSVMPSNDYYSVLAISPNLNSTDYIHQVAFERGKSNIYYRRKYNGTFTEWKKFITEDNFTSQFNEVFSTKIETGALYDDLGLGNYLKFESHYGYFYTIRYASNLTFYPDSNSSYNDNSYDSSIDSDYFNSVGFNLIAPNENFSGNSITYTNSRCRTGIYNRKLGIVSAPVPDTWNSGNAQYKDVMNFTSYILLSQGMTDGYKYTLPHWRYVKLSASTAAGITADSENYVDTIYLPSCTSGTLQIAASDSRLKDNIKDTEIEALPLVNSIKFREFDWNNRSIDNHQNIGVVADELEKLDPHLVLEGTGGYSDDGEMNIKCVDTFYLMGYYGKAIQELYDIIEQQKKEINELKRKFNSET